MRIQLILLFLLCASAGLSDGSGADRNSDTSIIGIKIYDHKGDFEQLFDTFADLGINTVFASEILSENPVFREQAKSHHMKIFVIEPIFLLIHILGLRSLCHGSSSTNNNFLLCFQSDGPAEPVEILRALETTSLKCDDMSN
jgi:hypothetical protein